MKVIIVNYRYYIAGGPEKYMFKFMEAAQKRGIEVIPFSVQNKLNEYSRYSNYFARPRSKELMYSDTRKTLGNIIGVLRATLWNYDAEHKLRKLIRDVKPDVVYVLHEVNHLSPSVIRAAKRENVRVVHRISDFFMFCARYDFLCGDEICEACLGGRYGKALYNSCVKGSKMATLLRVAAMKLYDSSKIFQCVDAYVTTCEFSKKKLVEGGISVDTITTIPTFIDAINIVPCYENDKYFLLLGRMAKQKGVIYAVEAMKYLGDNDYKLVITGSITQSEEDQKIWEYIHDNNLDNKIVFSGFVKGEELENLIKKSTCIVSPAIWYENMPNTVIEAYAYGKPVVASDIGSLAEIVEDNVTGRLFEVKNAKKLAKVLNEFIEDETLSSRLGMNARKRCLELYSEDKHMEELVKVLAGK